MIIARSPFSVRRAVRTYKETLRVMEAAYNDGSNNKELSFSESRGSSMAAILYKARIAVKAAGVAVATELGNATLV